MNKRLLTEVIGRTFSADEFRTAINDIYGSAVEGDIPSIATRGYMVRYIFDYCEEPVAVVDCLTFVEHLAELRPHATQPLLDAFRAQPTRRDDLAGSGEVLVSMSFAPALGKNLSPQALKTVKNILAAALNIEVKHVEIDDHKNGEHFGVRIHGVDDAQVKALLLSPEC